jgi:para-nitrobenzyl esterase
MSNPIRFAAIGLAIVGASVMLNACGESPPENAVATADATEQVAVEQLVQVADPMRPIAETQYGPVRGYVEDSILTFKGVRYGADTATTRFAPPAAPAAWNEPVDAIAYGPSAPQPARGNLSLFQSWLTDPNPGTSEDCLFLNVWTPALDDGKRPVMVWLHGGGFTTGSGSSNAYDGVRLADGGDVVIVTVNHRLNVFGYLYLDEYGDEFSGSGNAGMLDLVAALEWVRDNAEQFGGDPDNVLIFGESGGGWKVSTLMAMDAAEGLFHRAVVQSGPGLTLMEPETAAAATAALLAELGLEGARVAELRTLPTETITAAAVSLASEGVSVGNRPVVDGVHNLRHPFTPMGPQQSKDVPLLIGSNRTEMSMLAGAGNRQLFDLTWETLPAALEQGIPGVDAQAVIDGYRELHPEIDAVNLFFEAITDTGAFGRGSFELADRKAEQNGADVYQYYFSWPTPVEGGMWSATHALDIGFVFDNVAKSASMSGVGERQQALADVMSDAWLAFARTGNPSHPGLPEWPAYDQENRATMVFDDQSRVINDPRGRERALIDAAL